MDRRDQELLDKQLGRINLSPRNYGVIVVFTSLAMFLAGMALGGFLFAYKSEPMKIASSEAIPPLFFPNGALPSARH